MIIEAAQRGFSGSVLDELISEALKEDYCMKDLYGRCNELTDPDGFVFANIVEVVPSGCRIKEDPRFTSDKEHGYLNLMPLVKAYILV